MMRRFLYALTIAGLLGVSLVGQQQGGAFVPGFNYTIAGNWTHSGTTAFTGVATLTSPVMSDPTITGTTAIGAGATLTSPILTTPTSTFASQSPTTTFPITAAMSGSVIFLNSTTAFVSTLPAPAVGLRYTLILKGVPASGAHTVVTATSSNIIKGMQFSAAGDAGDTGTADDTISFVTAQTVAGDRVELWSDGTSWFAAAYSTVAAAITFTQAS